MNHKSLVQDVLDGNQSAVEACALILQEIDSLQESFMHIVDGGMHEWKDNSTHGFHPPIDARLRLTAFLHDFRTKGIKLEGLAIRTDVRSRKPFTYPLPWDLTITESNLLAGLKFLASRSIYEDYLKM